MNINLQTCTVNQPTAGLSDHIIVLQMLVNGDCLYLKCQEANLVQSERTDEELGRKQICLFQEDITLFLQSAGETVTNVCRINENLESKFHSSLYMGFQFKILFFFTFMLSNV